MWPISSRGFGSGPARLAGSQIGRLGRIVAEVVQLRPRTVDIVKPRVDERAQLAPSEVNARVEGFGVNRPRRVVVLLHAEEIQKRRKDLGQPDGSVDGRV